MRARRLITAFPMQAEAVTPSDVNEFDHPATVYVGGAGNVTVEPEIGDNTVLFTAVEAGSLLPVQVRRVLATGTTATVMVRVW